MPFMNSVFTKMDPKIKENPILFVTICYVTNNVVFSWITCFFKSLVNKVWVEDTKGKKINWTYIREVRAESSDPNKLYFKCDLT